MGRPLDSVPYRDTCLFKDATIESKGVVESEILDVISYTKKTIFVKSVGVDVKVDVLVGVDPDNLCRLKTGTRTVTVDTDTQWDCNNELIAFEVIEHCPCMQIVLNNQTSAAGTVSVWFSGE
jgi:hypothetical protein